MMRMSRHLLCMTLILCLLVSAVSMTAFAMDGTALNGVEAVTKSGNLSGENNSHLADVVKDGVQSTKLNENHLSMLPSNTTAGDPITGDLYPSHFQTYGPVCEELREALKLRKSEIYLYYCLDKELTEADFDALMIDAATGMGDWNDYGDYLMHSVLDYGYYAEYIQSEGLNYYVIGYAVAYLTTFEQEQELEQKIMELKPVILEGAENSYQRIKAIHDYIAANVSYDLDNAKNPDYLLQHSAYAALMHGKCSAQGFTMLFYRMAELYDLHCRIILGSVDGMPFMWNMVRFDSENWYNVNMAADVLDGTDAYFMKGTSDFPDNHQPADFYLTPEFMENFPISEAGLDPECALSGSAGDNVTWRFNAVTNEFIVSGQGKMKDELCLSHEVQNAQNLALVVEEGITYIGSRSFEGGIFTSVALPDSLTEIGKYAFCESPITSVRQEYCEDRRGCISALL